MLTTYQSMEVQSSNGARGPETDTPFLLSRLYVQEKDARKILKENASTSDLVKFQIPG